MYINYLYTLLVITYTVYGYYTFKILISDSIDIRIHLNFPCFFSCVYFYTHFGYFVGFSLQNFEDYFIHQLKSLHDLHTHHLDGILGKICESIFIIRCQYLLVCFMPLRVKSPDNVFLI